jgi:hypothetical protein
MTTLRSKALSPAYHGQDLGIAGFGFALSAIVFGYTVALESSQLIGLAFAFTTAIIGVTISTRSWVQSRRAARVNLFAQAGVVISSVTVAAVLVVAGMAAALGAGGTVTGSCTDRDAGSHTLADGSALVCSSGIFGTYN